MKTLVQGPLNEEKINVIINNKPDLQAGGHCIFWGQVRNDIKNEQKVVSIEYSAYDEMVEKESNKIKQEILEKYNDVRSVEIYHSKGEVKAGENSLYVKISAGHRIQAFESIQECVNLIKKRLPIWKKENLSDGTYIWTE